MAGAPVTATHGHWLSRRVVLGIVVAAWLIAIVPLVILVLHGRWAQFGIVYGIWVGLSLATQPVRDLLYRIARHSDASLGRAIALARHDMSTDVKRYGGVVWYLWTGAAFNLLWIATVPADAWYDLYAKPKR